MSIDPNNETGQVRFYHDDLEWCDESSVFMWTEGNYGCDCNRSLFFYGVPPDHEIESPCGEGRFTVLFAELPNGTRVVLDPPKNADGEAQHVDAYANRLNQIAGLGGTPKD